MSEHTKEPWRVGQFHSVLGKISETEIFDSEIFADVIASTRTAPMHPEAKANARRIVACVNACAGIETEKLEAVAFLSPHLPDGHKDAAIEIAALRTQRDELLAAAKKLLPFLTSQGEMLDAAALNDGRACDFDMASVAMREAITKAGASA